jgi:hypothetical protein
MQQLQSVHADSNDQARHWRGAIQGLPAAAAGRHAGEGKQYTAGCSLASVFTYVVCAEACGMPQCG